MAYPDAATRQVPESGSACRASIVHGSLRGSHTELMSSMDPVVQQLNRVDLREAVEVLALAFEREHHFGLIFTRNRRQCLRHLMHMCLVDGLRCGRVDTVRDEDGQIAAAAVWLAPGAWPITGTRSLRGLPDLVQVVRWGGVTATRRLARFGLACARTHLREPHWFLEVLGVRPDAQGRRYGRVLLEHGLAVAARDAVPAWLDTQEERSVRWYQRSGFRCHGKPLSIEDYSSWNLRWDPGNHVD